METTKQHKLVALISTGVAFLSIVLSTILTYAYLNNLLLPSVLSNPPMVSESQRTQGPHAFESVFEPSPNGWVALLIFFLGYFSVILAIGNYIKYKGRTWSLFKTDLVKLALIGVVLSVGAFTFISNWPDANYGNKFIPYLFLSVFAFIALPLFFYQPTEEKIDLGEQKIGNDQITTGSNRTSAIGKIFRYITIALLGISSILIIVPYIYYLIDPNDYRYAGAFEPGYLWFPVLGLIFILPVGLITGIIYLFIRHRDKNRRDEGF